MAVEHITWLLGGWATNRLASNFERESDRICCDLLGLCEPFHSTFRERLPLCCFGHWLRLALLHCCPFRSLSRSLCLVWLSLVLFQCCRFVVAWARLIYSPISLLTCLYGVSLARQCRRRASLSLPLSLSRSFALSFALWVSVWFEF